MLQDSFTRVYVKIKLHFYQQIFRGFESREASLTAVETFCAEVICELGKPTIREFANFVRISQANATYKVNSLIKKGYVNKERSAHDKREYILKVTEKYFRYYDISREYVSKVVKRIEKRFSKEEVKIFKNMLDIIERDLMPEIAI